jgi:hypothetical protein
LCFAQLATSTPSRSSISGLSTRRLTSTLNILIFLWWVPQMLFLIGKVFNHLVIKIWKYFNKSFLADKTAITITQRAWIIKLGRNIWIRCNVGKLCLDSTIVIGRLPLCCIHDSTSYHHDLIILGDSKWLWISTYDNYVRKSMWQLCGWGMVHICMTFHKRAFDTIAHWFDNVQNCATPNCQKKVNSIPPTQFPHKFLYIVAILIQNHFESPNIKTDATFPRCTDSRPGWESQWFLLLLMRKVICIPWVFYFTEHRIHGSVSLVAYFKWIDLSILKLNIAILHCMFSEIKNAVYTYLILICQIPSWYDLYVYIIHIHNT